MAISRRDLLGGALGAVVAAGAPARKLNFVFILIDDMGWTDLACYGSKLYETPNIDRLAARGMKFTNAYAAAPLCSPTRASVLTGKYPARLHLTMALPGRLRPKPTDKYLSPEMPPGLAHSEVTIAEALKTAGYATASIGKWHLGKDQYLPENHGFDLNIGGTDAGMAPHQFYPGWKGKTRGVPIEGRDGEYLTDRLTDEALKFIDSNKDRPFFLYLAHYAVHTPVEAKQELIEKYRRKIKPGDAQHNPVYAAMVEGVDESVGRVMAKLEQLGIAGNTVVFFHSDNGGVDQVQTYTPDPLPPTANLPLRKSKCWLYEGGIRVPTIVSWPGVIKPGSVSHTPIVSPDFYPTMTELAGVKVDSRQQMDGVSLAPLLKQKGSWKRDTLYWYYPHYDFRPAAAIRERDYKLIEFLDDDHLELYNLEQDIGEQNNLAESMPKKAVELQKRLHDWEKSVNVQVMPPNPGYKPAP